MLSIKASTPKNQITAKKGAEAPPHYRTTGTDTTQQQPRTEHAAGRTQTDTPTRRDAARPNAAATPAELKNAQTTDPENERDDDRKHQDKQPEASAKPDTERNDTSR